MTKANEPMTTAQQIAGIGCLLLLLFVALPLVTKGCGASSTSGPDSGSGSSPNSVRVTREEYGDQWPLTVDAGTLIFDRGVLFKTDDGTTYTVNGKAIGNHPELPQIDAIWAEDTTPGMTGLKKDIGPLIDRGNQLETPGG